MQDHTLRREAVLASEAPIEARRAFIKRTYAHLAAAIFMFMGVEYLLISNLERAITLRSQESIAHLQEADRRYWRKIIAELKQLRSDGILLQEGSEV